jgi:hypothetical protein
MRVKKPVQIHDEFPRGSVPYDNKPKRLLPHATAKDLDAQLMLCAAPAIYSDIYSHSSER